MENRDDSWDVFISYASEDRDEVAEPLAQHLRSEGLNVWFDRFELRLGDSLHARIDEGLARCKYGVVIVSDNFFRKHFPMRELQGLTQREVEGQKVILPVWHRITAKRVREFSPPLGDRVSADTSEGLQAVAARILEAVRRDIPNQSDARRDISPIEFASVGKSEFQRALDEFAGTGSLRDILKDW
jgi:hypothetical protein